MVGKYSGPVTHYMIFIDLQETPAGNNYRHLALHRIENKKNAPHRVVSWSTMTPPKLFVFFFFVWELGALN